MTALQGQLTQTHLTRKGEIAEQMGCRRLGKDQDKAGHSRTHTALQAPTLSRAANVNSASPSLSETRPELNLTFKTTGSKEPAFRTAVSPFQGSY